MIDSEQVPWGKGEKQAGEAVEIEPETIRLQGSEARKGDTVPIEEWSNDLWCIACVSPKGVYAQGNRVLIGRNPLNFLNLNNFEFNNLSGSAVHHRPEARWACLGQDESPRNGGGGPNRLVVQNLRMSWGKEWKANRIW